MNALEIELGPNLGTSTCPHCGSEASTIRGFLYRGGDAYALYFAALYPSHEDRRMALDIAIGDWGEAAPADARLRVALEVWPTESEIEMHVHDRADWNWADSQTLGRLLGREEALARPEIDWYFEVADFVVSRDPRIASYLDARLK